MTTKDIKINDWRSKDHTGEIHNGWLLEDTGERYNDKNISYHKIKKYKYTCTKCGHTKYANFSKKRTEKECKKCRTRQQVKLKQKKEIRTAAHHGEIIGNWLLEDTGKKAYNSRNTLYKYTCTKCGYVKYEQYAKKITDMHCVECNKKAREVRCKLEHELKHKQKLNIKCIKEITKIRKNKYPVTRKSKYFKHLRAIAKILDCTEAYLVILNNKLHILESEEAFYNYLDSHVHFKDGSKFKDIDMINTKWCTMDEACEKLYRSKIVIKRLMMEGHLSYIDYLPRKILLLASDVDNLVGKDIRKNHI